MAKALTGSSKPRGTALNGGMPPPPIDPSASVNAPPGQPGPPPAPSHNQTVAALRHFQIFLDLEKSWLSNPEMGRTDMKDAFIEGYTKLVADRQATPVQAIQALSQVPERPFEQKKWVIDNMQRNLQARDIVLQHHAQAFAGQPPQEAPDPDNHMADIQGMMTSHYGPGQQGGQSGQQGMPSYAFGGQPQVGQPAVVGEHGPEIFVPHTQGTIVPNHQTGISGMLGGQGPVSGFSNAPSNLGSFSNGAGIGGFQGNNQISPEQLQQLMQLMQNKNA